MAESTVKSVFNHSHLDWNHISLCTKSQRWQIIKALSNDGATSDFCFQAPVCYEAKSNPKIQQNWFFILFFTVVLIKENELQVWLQSLSLNHSGSSSTQKSNPIRAFIFCFYLVYLVHSEYRMKTLPKEKLGQKIVPWWSGNQQLTKRFHLNIHLVLELSAMLHDLHHQMEFAKL